MKKILALVLAMCTVLCIAVGCSTVPAPEEAAQDVTEAPAAEATAAQDAAASTEASSDDQITVGVDLYYRRDEYYVDLESTFRTSIFSPRVVLARIFSSSAAEG